MNENLRKLYINDLDTLFNQIDTPLSVIDNIQFAEMAHLLLEDKLGITLDRRGQSLTGEPVGYVLDTTSTDSKVVAEYSCEKKYFTDKNLIKIENDIQHCLEKAPNAEHIYLISNRTAGPSIYTEYSNYSDKKSKDLNKTIEILDARKISEYIVDEVILTQNEILIEKLIPYLPIVKKLNEEYIFTNTLPQNDDYFIERVDNKRVIIELLEKNNYVLLHGISGIGKTEIAKDIASFYHETYSIVWLDGSTIKKEEDLKAIKIERYNVSQNIIGLMKNSKVCLVIDDLNSNILEVISFIRDNIKVNYKLIITSQIDVRGIDSKLKINFLPEELSRKILNNDLGVYCSDEVFRKIDKKIGGHPFLLRQINILVKEEELNWDEVDDELDKLLLSEVENQKTFYNKLFEKHINSVSESLACLKWINCKKIDSNLLKGLIGITGIKKLEHRSFFNIRNNFTYSLHDLVFDSLRHVTITYNEKLLKQELSKKLSKWYLEYSTNYFRVIYSHKDLIQKLVLSEKYDIFSYSYINALSIDEFTNKVIVEYSDKDIKRVFESYSKDKYFELFTWIELIEKEYLYRKENFSREEVKSFLCEKIDKVELFLTNSNLPQEIYIEVQNHLAKYYRNSGNKEKAINIFENILSLQSDYYVAKLHLSKLIRFDKKRKEEAEILIQEILEAFKEGKKVSSTVILAAYIEIRSYKKLEDIYLIDLIENFQELINSVIVDKFDMPYQTLSALSSRIQFKYPDKMIEMTKELPIPSEESLNQSILFDIGQIYFNTSKAYSDLSDQAEALENAHIAKSYFEKMNFKDKYKKRMISENYLLLNEFDSAITLLNEVSLTDRDIWWNYTYAKALSLSGKNDKALDLISECINEATYSQETFYRERANIKIKAGEDPCDDLKIAHNFCRDVKFSKMILDEIANNNCE